LLKLPIATLERVVTTDRNEILADARQLQQTARWSANDVARIAAANAPTIPVIAADDVRALIPGLDLWDSWPIQTRDGRTASIGGATLWMMLSSRVLPDPALRHGEARIRLIAQTGNDWVDCGNLLPDGFSPGTREWAGSAILDDDDRTVTLYFTATGRPGEPFSFEQRLFETTGTLRDGNRAIDGWSVPTEIVASDGHHYVDTHAHQGVPGLIKGFRDPGYFRDPADGRDYLVFTGSDGANDHDYNGIVGLIARGANGWTLQPPIYSALGLCNELERPHIIVRGGLYYLFWSTQRHVFAPDGPSGPNGLYGVVAESMRGPYRPLNRTGLVAACPPGEPTQSYSWLVLDTLDVVSFIDYWGMAGRKLADHPDLVRSNFGGTAAPLFRIELDGDTSRIIA
jgi:levansucrase